MSMRREPATPADLQEVLYREVTDGYAAALERLVRAYEHDPERRRDLLQEVHLALWRSLALFDNRCSRRTWVYRVAHNAAISHGIRRSASAPRLLSLDEVEERPDESDFERDADRRMSMDRLLGLIHSLKPLDRQVALLYLEGLDATSIGEVTGSSPGGIATKVHRLKKLLTRQFHERGRRGK
jgi:RNA polymerase sigma-70 factor (ECF subfamily)